MDACTVQKKSDSAMGSSFRVRNQSFAVGGYPECGLVKVWVCCALTAAFIVEDHSGWNPVISLSLRNQDKYQI
eukprot:scaffold99426_cov23-Tisochrysis_lutea.AAC.1